MKKCTVCGNSYQPKGGASYTCSEPCRKFRKKYVMKGTAAAEAKAAFEEMSAYDWAMEYMCGKDSHGGSSYRKAAFEDDRWAHVNNLVDEVRQVFYEMEQFVKDAPLTTMPEKYTMWKRQTPYTECSRSGCSNHVSFHESRGYGQYCGTECQRADMGDTSSDLYARTMDSHGLIDKVERERKHRETMMKRHGVEISFQKPELMDKALATRKANGNHGSSKMEMELADHIESLGFNIERNNRDLLGVELDIVIPELKIAFEINGVIYHSSKYDHLTNKKERLARYRHKHKTDECAKIGYRLVHIWSDELNTKTGLLLWKEKITNMLGASKPKSYARQTHLVTPTKEEYTVFLQRHHVQGSTTGVSLAYGLKKDDELVAVMLFTKRQDGYELVRYAANGCVGGFSKLLKAHRSNYTAPVISFADLCTVDRENNVYVKNGFEMVEEVRPDYSYTSGGGRIHKFNMRKDKLIKRHPDVALDMDMTEGEMTDILGYHKVWNVGLLKYVLR
ncbi:homing endonuclease F-LimVII [Vibrio phage YC]|uniref:Homing endonuclease F-LimVII n=1 Tax=Vibrio phage YC TaxID=2267403 RepID=A0A384ZSC4_9CAUD|nr:homing endonuclease [Vibrio phage YC]AXC34514.1 homing endonuclease F-LimVII [Vibrio phage YC]